MRRAVLAIVTVVCLIGLTANVWAADAPAKAGDASKSKSTTGGTTTTTTGATVTKTTTGATVTKTTTAAASGKASTPPAISPLERAINNVENIVKRGDKYMEYYNKELSQLNSQNVAQANAYKALAAVQYLSAWSKAKNTHLAEAADNETLMEQHGKPAYDKGVAILIAMGNEERSKKHFTAAVGYYQQILAADPENAQAKTEIQATKDAQTAAVSGQGGQYNWQQQYDQWGNPIISRGRQLFNQQRGGH